jgi:hypothetical protein
MWTFLLTVHITSGSLALLVGPLAMLASKRPGRHPRLGRAYELLIALLCLSAGGLAVLKPSLWWLGLIAALTWAAALGGWWMRRRQPRGWLQWHVSLMCGSYLSLVTALLVVSLNGTAIAWIAPTVVGSPLIAWTNIRLARRGTACARASAVADRQLLDAVQPARAQPHRVARLADVGHVVGDRVEDQVDLQLGQAGPEAEMRPAAAEAQMRVGAAADVE